MKKAGFFRRLLAAMIDGFLFGVLAEGVNGGLGLFLWIAYETVLVSQWKGFTIGKKIMEIRVVPVSGGQVDWLKSLVRALSQVLSGLFLGLGYLWMLWDGRSQTWHDKIAETYVVEA